MDTNLPDYGHVEEDMGIFRPQDDLQVYSHACLQPLMNNNCFGIKVDFQVSNPDTIINSIIPFAYDIHYDNIFNPF